MVSHLSTEVYGSTESAKSVKNNSIIEKQQISLDSMLARCNDPANLRCYEIVAEESGLYYKDAQYYKVAELTSRYLRKLDLMKDTARSERFKKVHTDLLFWYGYSLAHMGHYDKAIKQFYDILKLYGSKEDSYSYLKACRGLGAAYGLCNKDAKSEEFSRKTLKAARKLKDYEGVCGSLSNLGVLQLRKQQADSALVYLMEANKVAIQHPEKCEKERVLYLIGAAYCSLEKNDWGIKYLQEAISVAKSKEKYHLLFFIENYYIHRLVKTGHFEEAKKECLKHYETVKKYHAKDLEADALNVLAKLYSREKNYEKAYHYLELNRQANDSLFNKESEERLEALNIDFENYKIEQARKVMQKDIQLSKANIEKRNLWITILLVIVIAFIGFSVWFTKRYFAQRRLARILRKRLENLNAQRNAQLNSMRERLENEVGNKELITGLITQMDANETIIELQKKIQVLKSSFASGGKVSMLIGEMENLVNSLNKNEDLKAFQFYFEQIHDSFFEHLSETYPDLTQGEKRLCALISLNLTTKEIASLINRTVRGVETAKFRLRKKLQLNKDDSLTDFMTGIKSRV